MVLLSFFLKTAAWIIFFPINVFESTLVMTTLQSFVKTIKSSISLQSHIYSSFLRDVPIKPSSLLTYSLVFLITTFVASTSSNNFISVFLSLFSE